MLPHQQRVVDEQVELSDKLVKLSAFISGGPVFTTLPARDQDLLRRQRDCMTEYHEILEARIGAF